eukprot:4079714-Amphidinium_carterae.1
MPNAQKAEITFQVIALSIEVSNLLAQAQGSHHARMHRPAIEVLHRLPASLANFLRPTPFPPMLT